MGSLAKRGNDCRAVKRGEAAVAHDGEMQRGDVAITANDFLTPTDLFKIEKRDQTRRVRSPDGCHDAPHMAVADQVHEFRSALFRRGRSVSLCRMSSC